MRGNGRKGATTKIMPVAISHRPPPMSGSATAFILSAISLFPVVHAWSPWKKKQTDGEEEDGDKILSSRRTNSSSSLLRLVDKKDKELKKDIAKADELFETGNTANYEDASKILRLHLV